MVSCFSPHPFLLKPGFRQVSTINRLYHNHRVTILRIAVCCVLLVTRQEKLESGCLLIKLNSRSKECDRGPSFGGQGTHCYMGAIWSKPDSGIKAGQEEREATASCTQLLAFATATAKVSHVNGRAPSLQSPYGFPWPREILTGISILRHTVYFHIKFRSLTTGLSFNYLLCNWVGVKWLVFFIAKSQGTLPYFKI